MQTLSIEEVAETIVDRILQETFLNKGTLLPIVIAQIKILERMRSTPKNYNAYESPTKQAARLRTIEQKETEQRFWRDKMKEVVPDISVYFSELDNILISKGFKK